jgi:hypothetical protein
MYQELSLQERRHRDDRRAVMRQAAIDRRKHVESCVAAILSDAAVHQLQDNIQNPIPFERQSHTEPASYGLCSI